MATKVKKENPVNPVNVQPKKVEVKERGISDVVESLEMAKMYAIEVRQNRIAANKSVTRLNWVINEIGRHSKMLNDIV